MFFFFIQNDLSLYWYWNDTQNLMSKYGSLPCTHSRGLVERGQEEEEENEQH